MICDFCYQDRLVIVRLPITLVMDISPFCILEHEIENTDDQELICSSCIEVEQQQREGKGL